MERFYQAQVLREFVERISLWPPERLLKLQAEPATEEFDASTVEASEHCSLEAQLLQVIEPNVLHITLNAWSTSHSLGADIFVHGNGIVEWDERIYELIDGVPRQMKSS